MAERPWSTAEIAGPIRARALRKPEEIADVIKSAKNPILIAGHKILVDEGEGSAIDHIIKLAQAYNIPVVATAHTIKEFLSRGFHPAAWMPAVDIGNRLKDPEWQGIEGRGKPDLAIFVGLPYYMQWVILNGLKHFAKDLKTLSLDPYYHPNASLSLTNIIRKKRWLQLLEQIANLA